MSLSLKGINVSPGVEIGKACLYDAFDNVPGKTRQISENDVEQEVARFKKSMQSTVEEIKALHNQIADDLGEQQASILEAQLLFLEDKYLIEKTEDKIRSDKVSADSAFSMVIEETQQTFASLGSHYLQGRVEDIRYIGRRVLKHLDGAKTVPISEITEKVIIVAHDLSPADTAMMNKNSVIAFVTDIGSRTSHTAIMARSIGIPAVVGLKNVTQLVRDGDTLIVDGTSGEVIVNPEDVVLKEFRKRKESYSVAEKALGELVKLPAQTLDGYQIKLMANIELPAELPAVISSGADGIGLYRSEFLYLNRKHLPDEDEQYEAYREVIERASPHRVVIRTVDLGGDKFVSEMELSGEMNPFLGWRGIRFSLEQPEIFKIQIRAILRAASYGKAGIMFPLVSCMEECLAAKHYVEEAKSELKKEGVRFDENIETGVMIETPSAAMISDILAGEVDFFSIGTNDLIQYSMAVDRVNEKVAHLYRPAHPGILRLLKIVIDAGNSKGVRIDMCGEMAGEEEFVMILLGLGIDGLSMSPLSIPRVKKMIRNITYREAKHVADKVLEMSTAQEVEDFVKSIELDIRSKHNTL